MAHKYSDCPDCIYFDEDEDSEICGDCGAGENFEPVTLGELRFNYSVEVTIGDKYAA